LTQKETVDAINGCLIQAFPSHHLDAVTCLTNLAIVFLINITGMHKNKAHRTM
jgi:hypothetical protein